MPAHDLIIIGAGPGGYVAAIRAAQLGLNVACVEKESALGGTCLRVGCIPSKALLESSEKFVETKNLSAHGITIGPATLNLPALMKRKDQVVSTLTRGIDALFKKNKIHRLTGTATLKSAGEVEVSSPSGVTHLTAPRIILATGSQPSSLPGIQFDGHHIVTSTEALSFPSVPAHLVVIGAGYIGLELGSAWQRLGARVTIVESLPRILPGMDAELAADALKIFTRQGIEFRLGQKVRGARADASGAVVEMEGSDPIHCDQVLVAVGRHPNTAGLNLEGLGVKLGPRGRVEVNEHFETSVPGIFAIGDLIRGPMLAHKAEEEGIACVEQMVTGFGHVDYRSIPGVVYTEPEIASVGETEEQLKEAGTGYRTGIFPFRGNGRAHALGSVEGKVKILADAKTDRVLGVHIIGPRAGDLIAEAAVAMAFGASAEDIARSSHAHPTLAEAIKEAALAVDGRAIHS